MAFRIIALSFAGLALTACAPQSIGERPASSTSETVQVGQAAYSVGDYEEAARIYERAAARDNKSSAAYLGLGRSYTQLGQYNRAHNALLRAQSLSSRDPEISNELGNLALQQMQPARAIKYFDESLARDRRNIKGLTGKAVSLDYLSRHAEAQSVYREALSIYPTNFALMSNYALSQVLSRNLGSGIQMMQELLRDSTQGNTVRNNLALAYMLANREGDARAILQGMVPDSEINEILNGYVQVRENYRAGKPIGYLVFGSA